MNRFIKLILYGNYFYGACAIGLSIEAALQQRFPLSDVVYYILVFAVTVLYYTKAYISETASSNTTNKRSLWYIYNRRLVITSQIVLTIVMSACLLWIAFRNWEAIIHISGFNIFLLLIFPAIAGLYYGISHPRLKRFNLRNVGWLKPFVIGFSWAGLVSVYPVLYDNVLHQADYEFTLLGNLLFLKNFMFVTVLCIMFDIKDYAMDYNHQIKTFVVNNGLRKTIFYIIIPLCILGLGVFLLYGSTHQFSLIKILLNTIPFVMLIVVAYSMHSRRSILYYLGVIDGMMLVKAICGSIAMIYF